MRIAIANDVAIAVEALRRVIASVPGYRLAWVAVDGAEAVERCRQDTPDLILMDLIMPVMDGAAGNPPHHGGYSLRHSHRHRDSRRPLHQSLRGAGSRRAGRGANADFRRQRPTRRSLDA